jgi:exoribonuclease-2
MDNTHRNILQDIARKAMIARGLEPDFSAAELNELTKITLPAIYRSEISKDLRNLLWCSIDNACSLDLDQLSYAEPLPGKKTRLLVAVADVDALVTAESGINNHACINTASVYTIAQVFPMLPDKLSASLTSLSLDSDRCSVIVDMVVCDDGAIEESSVYLATVCNHAKLEYNSIAAWIEGTGSIPSEITSINGLAENLKLQDQVAQKMKVLRHNNGALDFETDKASPVFDGDYLSEMKVDNKNRANAMIEEFMIAANGATARYLTGKKFPSLRRVVRTPKRWDRIVELASENGFSLPETADSKSLSQYIRFIKQKEPLRFTEMSINVLKLLGSGEYVAETPDSVSPGHFGLAVKDYEHSTAPNRRYPDLITQRLLKSAITGRPVPYTPQQLEEIAHHCTLKASDVRKVERQVEKSANAMLMESRIGEVFDAVVSGASPKGTWIRILHPHMEGKLIRGFIGLEVGHKIKARLTYTNVADGFIDFEKIN